jgi:putative Ca2+/H+ antiporter (TMEM165/GDT1 family)
VFLAVAGALVLSTAVAVTVGAQIGTTVSTRVLKTVAGIGFLLVRLWALIDRSRRDSMRTPPAGAVRSPAVLRADARRGRVQIHRDCPVARLMLGIPWLPIVARVPSRATALPVCYGDRSMLKLVVVNLVSNAVKFTRTRKPAEIEIGYMDRNTNESRVVRERQSRGLRHAVCK